MNSFDNLLKIRSEFIAALNLKVPDKFPSILIGNKCDLPDRKVPKEKVMEWCKLHGGITYIETSATKNEKVGLAFETVTKQAMNAAFNKISISLDWEYITPT